MYTLTRYGYLTDEELRQMKAAEPAKFRQACRDSWDQATREAFKKMQEEAAGKER